MSANRNRPGEVSQAASEALIGAAPILAEVLDNGDSWWRDCAERALAHWAESGLPFTADDLRELGVPEADHPNRWGALFATFHRRGVIEAVGYQVSTRRSRHGGVLRVWRGVSSRMVGQVAS